MRKKQDGFTLIEILIVLGILATLVISTASRPRNQQKEYKKFFRQLTLMSKEIKNRAEIEKATYRMLFILEDEKPLQISVEKTNKQVLLGSEKEAKEKLTELFKQRTSKKTDKKKKDPEGFRPSKKFKAGRLSIPKGIQIKQIEVSGLPEPVESGGVAIIHFFQQGLVEEAAIQIETQDKKLQWTALTDPITGEFYTFGKLMTLEEIQKR